MTERNSVEVPAKISTGPSFWSSVGGDDTPPSSSSPAGKKLSAKNGASEEDGWKSGMMLTPGTLKMSRPLFMPERGANMLWRERNGFSPGPGEEAARFNATDLRRSPLAAGILELPGTAPVALNDLGPTRETIFARKNDLLLGQAEFLMGKSSGMLPDGRKIEILRIAEIDPGVREDDPKSLLGRTVKRRTVVKLTERDGSTKTFTTTFDERYVPGPGGKPIAIKLAERIDVLEEATGLATIRRRIDRTFVLGSDGRPVQVASNEMLLGNDGNPTKMRDDKIVVDGRSEKRRSTTFYDIGDWKKRVYELDRGITEN